MLEQITSLLGGSGVAVEVASGKAVAVGLARLAEQDEMITAERNTANRLRSKITFDFKTCSLFLYPANYIPLSCPFWK
jgi:hypothetical protein